MREFAESIGAELTAKQAQVVRSLRVDRGFSWRAVAAEFCERFPDAEFAEGLAGNQLLGMALCEAAARMLGEDPDAAPWN